MDGLKNAKASQPFWPQRPAGVIRPRKKLVAGRMGLFSRGVAVLFFCLLAPRPLLSQKLERFSFEKAEMGLPVRVTLYAPSEAEAVASAEAAFARLEALNSIFTDYDSDSELSRLSDSSGMGREVSVSPELWHVLSFALHVSERSSGAFDITVGPVVNLWRTARRKKALPSEERLHEALARTGYALIRMNAATHGVELTRARMRLDMGGIAKGYMLEEARQVVVARGQPQCMLSGGGDMALGDPPPETNGWRVEVAALDTEGARPARLLYLRNCSVATSGDLYQRLEINGKRYSHIVDPRTGVGLTDHSQVTVIARRGIEADALSKVLAVLGPEEGGRIIEESPEVVARVIRAPAGGEEEWVSRGWKEMEARWQK